MFINKNINFINIKEVYILKGLRSVYPPLVLDANGNPAHHFVHHFVAGIQK